MVAKLNESQDVFEEKIDDRIESPKKGKVEILSDSIEVESVDNSVSILILQHPSEAKEIYGTGKLSCRVLKNSRLRIGLSWRSLRHAWKEECDPKRWAVLYLGKKGQSLEFDHGLAFLNTRDKPMAAPELDGVIILDGSWAKAKTYWWKNAWLRKLTRVALNPEQVSRYSIMRREPRKECLSTIESIALFLEKYSKDDEDSSRKLNDTFADLIEAFKQEK